jgi:hypothetical protein
MSKQYFVRRGTKIIGPFLPNDLKKRIADHKLRHSDGIASGSSGPWKQIVDIPALANLFDLQVDEDDYEDDQYGDDAYGDDEEYASLPVPTSKRKKKTRSQGDSRKPSGKVSEESGTPVFVLAIIGLLLMPICSPIAWIMGNSYLDRCNANGEQPDSLGSSGRIIGKVCTFFWGLALAILIVVVASLVIKMSAEFESADVPYRIPRNENEAVKIAVEEVIAEHEYDKKKANAKARVLQLKCRILIKRAQLNAPSYKISVGGVRTEWIKDAGVLWGYVDLESPKLEYPITVSFTQNDVRTESLDKWLFSGVGDVRLREQVGYPIDPQVRKNIIGKLNSVFHDGLEL